MYETLYSRLENLAANKPEISEISINGDESSFLGQNWKFLIACNKWGLEHYALSQLSAGILIFLFGTACITSSFAAEEFEGTCDNGSAFACGLLAIAAGVSGLVKCSTLKAGPALARLYICLTAVSGCAVALLNVGVAVLQWNDYSRGEMKVLGISIILFGLSYAVVCAVSIITLVRSWRRLPDAVISQ